MDKEKLLEFCNQQAGYVLSPPPITSEFPSLIPDIMLHPHEPNWLLNLVPVFVGAAKMSFPLYLSLSFVPSVVLRFKEFVKNPLLAAYKAVAGAARSTLFLALFPTVYQGVISIHHQLASKDNRYVYYAAGLASSCSIFVEKPHRRGELALYVMPRAADSLYQILNDRRWLFEVPFGEEILFASSMAAMM